MSGGIVIQFAQLTPYPDNMPVQDKLWSPTSITFPNECDHTNDSTRPVVHMLGVRLQTSNKQHAVQQWQTMLQGKLTRVDNNPRNGYQTYYYTFVCSVMYIAIDIYDNSNISDSFVCIDVATIDNQPIDLKHSSGKSIKAVFRQVPYPVI